MKKQDEHDPSPVPPCEKCGADRVPCEHRLRPLDAAARAAITAERERQSGEATRKDIRRAAEEIRRRGPPSRRKPRPFRSFAELTDEGDDGAPRLRGDVTTKDVERTAQALEDDFSSRRVLSYEEAHTLRRLLMERHQAARSAGGVKGTRNRSAEIAAANQRRIERYTGGDECDGKRAASRDLNMSRTTVDKHWPKRG